MVGIVLFLLIVDGCGKGSKENDIVPRSSLPPEKQEKIRSALRDVNYMAKAARSLFANEYGKEGVPFMIERIMEIYETGPDWEHPELYSIAGNLIFSLGEIGDARALPALKLWLIDENYRVFRSEAAYALGELGNAQATLPLWKVWEEERGYLEKGDDEGPWPFAGYHPSGCYVHGVLAEVSKALFKLGEKKIVGELIEVAEMSRGRWTGGYWRLLAALRAISGEPLSESTDEIEYWQKWWQENKSEYQ
jgi:hypothetical protein